MNTDTFIGKVKEKGFDAVAELSVSKAQAAIDVWQTHIRENDFQGFLTLNPYEVLSDAVSVLVLAYPYHTYKGYEAGIGFVSSYYIASNRAFTASVELADFLCSVGVEAVSTAKLPQKPLANAAGIGRYGKNGVIVRKGPHMVLATILINTGLGLPPEQTPVPDCGKCGKCEAACPASCLHNGYVNTSRCLRTYMAKNNIEIPDDLAPLMGERLLGCDDCLNACPGLERIPMPEEFKKLFAWDSLADEEIFAENKSAIADLVGANYAGALHKSAIHRLFSGHLRKP